MKIFSQGSYINFLLLLALIVLTGSYILALKQMVQSDDANRRVTHSYNVLEATTDLQVEFSNLELRINEAFLLHYPRTPQNLSMLFGQIQKNMNLLRQLSLDNPIQQHNLDQLEPIVKERLRFLQDILIKNPNITKQTGIPLMPDRKQLELKKSIAQIINGMRQEERSLLNKRDISYQSNIQKGHLLFALVASISEGLILLTLILLNYYLVMRNRAEQEKEENEERSRLIIDGVKDYAIIMLSPEGIITTWSAGAEKMKGYKADEMIGRHFSCFYPDEAIKNHHPEQGLFIANAEGRYEEEGWRVRKDGTQFLAHVVIRPLRSHEGNLIGYAKITRDLTESKKIERIKNEFISMVSHELRTPLTSIHGSISLLTEQISGAQTSESLGLLHIALNNTKRLIRLINDLLDIEKIEAGKMEFVYDIYSVDDLITESILANKSYADKFSVNITYTQKISGNVKVMIDHDRMIQTLTNLLSNAIKFSPTNAVVDITALIDHDSMVLIEVTDKGKGIPVEFRSSIFQKFAQADSSTGRKQQGTGLGLNISKLIIETMGGTIGYKSQENVGTTFYIKIPIYNTIDDGLKKVLLVNPAKPKILYAEDDLDLFKVIKSLLKPEYLIYHADSITAARKYIAENTYQLVLLDLKLTDGSGLELIPELYEKHIPIIVFTAYELPHQFLEQVERVFIKSKMSNDTLVKAIKDILNKNIIKESTDDR